MTFIKILNAGERHYGFQYKEGVNEIKKIGKRAYRGERQRTYGLFFTTLDNIEQYLHAGTHFRYVLEYDTATFAFVQNGSYKSTRLVLGKKQAFETVLVFDTLFLRRFPKFTPTERLWEFLAVDASLLLRIPDPPKHYEMRALIRYVGHYAYSPEMSGRFTVGPPATLGISEHVRRLYVVHQELRPRSTIVKEIDPHKVRIRVPEPNGEPDIAPTRACNSDEISKEISETMFREYSTEESCGLELRTLRMALHVSLSQMLFGILKVITVNPTLLKNNIVYCRGFVEKGDLEVARYLSNKNMLTPELADQLAKMVAVPRKKLKRFIKF